MRIALGQFLQETNSFNRNPTTRQDFETWGVAQGLDVIEKYGQTGELSGFLQGLEGWQPKPDVVGWCRLYAWSWGELNTETLSWVRQLIRENITAGGAVDGVLISLHGAMAADVEFDVSGNILRLIREEIGEQVPLVATLDLHANITPQMLQQADVLVGYLTSPHLDHRETGLRAAGALKRLIESGKKPVKWMKKLPMFTAAENHNTFTGPPAELYREIEAWEQRPEVLSAGLYMAQPWLDVPGLGWTITVHATEADPEWDERVETLADRCWELKQTINDVRRLNPQEVVNVAVKSDAFPVVIGDGADATNSGAPGDSTVLLRELLKQPAILKGALIFLVDPEAVAFAKTLEIGGEFDRFVGATFSPEYANPLRLRGKVERRGDLKFELNGHGGSRVPVDFGEYAIVRSGDVQVLLVEKTGPGSSPMLYESAGLDPRSAGIVIAKSPSGFRADYQSFAGQILLADGSGSAMTNWPRLKYQQINQPLWPLKEIGEPGEVEWCGQYSVSPTADGAKKSDE